MFLLAILLSVGVPKLRTRDVVVAICTEEGSSLFFGASRTEEALLWGMDYLNRDASKKGVRYRPVILRGSRPHLLVEAANRAGAHVLLAIVTSSFAETLLPYLDHAGIAAISPTASSGVLARPGDLLFRTNSDSAQEGAFLGGVARNQGVGRYVAILGKTDFTFSGGFLTRFREEVGKAPLRVLTVEDLLSREALLSLLREERLDGALLVLPDYPMAMVAQQLRLFLPGLPLWVASLGTTERGSMLLGRFGEGAHSVLKAPPDLLSREHPFAVFLRERYAGQLEPVAVRSAFAALAMLDEAIRLGGPDRKGIIKGLRSLDRVQGMDGPFTVDAAGDAHLPFYPATFCRGVWQVWDRIFFP